MAKGKRKAPQKDAQSSAQDPKGAGTKKQAGRKAWTVPRDESKGTAAVYDDDKDEGDSPTLYSSKAKELLKRYLPYLKQKHTMWERIHTEIYKTLN